jgi:hypothetical protein
VPVEAVDAGPAGNVEAGAINAIDGPIAFDLYAVNPEPTSGGAVLTVATVTEADQDALREIALAQLRQQALTSMQSLLGENEFLAPETLHVVGAPQETFSHFVGEKADTLMLDMQAVLAATSVNERAAQAVAMQAMNDVLSAGESLIPGSEQIDRRPTRAGLDDGRVLFSLLANGRVVPAVDREQVRQLVLGRKPGQAALALQAAHDLAEPPQIEYWPEWLGRLPWLEARIGVQVVTR